MTLAAFFDAGWDRVSMPGQLKISTSELNLLNSEFPWAGFTNEIKIAPGTQKLRSSTGLELQVILPIVNAPFRIYYAYNALRLDGTANPPIQITPSMFPFKEYYGAANYTYQLTRSTLGSNYKLLEPRKTFRFTVATTF